MGGCSTKKNGTLNRAYHNTTAKFNPLFNGEEALRYGTMDITQEHQDNYWVRLTVAPYKLPDPFGIKNTANAFFDRAEEKAILTVQKHSMLINGTQYNNQIAKAYLLLGKARYFNGRYLQAVEAFTYLIKNMNNSDEAVEAELWRTKSYLEMGQFERATRELTNMSRSASLSSAQYADVQAAQADALLRAKKDTLATKPLLRAIATEKSAIKRGRYAYLLGQVYEELEFADSAMIAYGQVLDLNRRVPRELWIHARLAQLKNNPPNDEETLKAYRKLLRSDEDRRFRDKIHYFYGAYLLKGMDTLNGEKAFNASLKTETKDRYLKALIYEQLGANRLNQVVFVTAGAYLDSTLQNLEDKTRRYRKIKRQRKKLDDIIAYENTIVHTDSLLRLIRMTPEAQKQVVNQYIEKLKKEKAKAEAIAQNGTLINAVQLGSFYFYNSRLVTAGKREFERNWANVTLADNWKYTPNVSLPIELVSDEPTSENTNKNTAFDPKTYLAQIPPSTAKDSLKRVQHEAYFQAGLAYKEQFSISKTATERFTTLIDKKPPKRYLLPTWYHLYELYDGNPEKQHLYSTQIITNFPKSDYAKIIQNPEILAENLALNKAELATAKTLFAAQDYLGVISKSEKQIPLLTNKSLQASWALLRAKSIGKLDGLDAFKEALEGVVETYPKTEDAAKAKAQLDGFDVFDAIEASDDEKAKLVFIRTRQQRKQSEEDKAWVDTWILEQGISKRLRTSIDIIDRNMETLVIHGFSSEASARKTRDSIRASNPRLMETKNIVFLTSDYRNALIHKRLEKLGKN